MVDGSTKKKLNKTKKLWWIYLQNRGKREIAKYYGKYRVSFGGMGDFVYESISSITKNKLYK